MDYVSVLLASAVPIVLAGALVNRCVVTHTDEKGNVVRGRGIGWQFIRFSVLATAIPVIGILTMQGMMDKNAAYVLLAAAIGYAFGKASEKKE